MNAIISGVIAAIATQATIFAVLGFVGRTLTKHITDDLLERSKKDLKVEADTQIERLKNELGKTADLYRTQLKKSEWVFQKEFEASARLNVLFREFVPNRSRPDSEWYDALDSISAKFHDTEERLRSFVADHTPSLLRSEIDAIEKCIYLANDGYLETSGPEDDEARQVANSLYDQFKSVNDSLHDRVRSQSVI